MSIEHHLDTSNVILNEVDYDCGKELGLRRDETVRASLTEEDGEAYVIVVGAEVSYCIPLLDSEIPSIRRFFSHRTPSLNIRCEAQNITRDLAGLSRDVKNLLSEIANPY